VISTYFGGKHMLSPFSSIKQLSAANNSQIIIYLVLALLMILTRPYHFASALHLPSASLAVFFLCGFFQSRFSTFMLFFALSVIIDLASSYVRGAFGDCITPSYPFLIIGYFSLWYSGKHCFFILNKTTEKHLPRAFIKTLTGLLIASSVAFLTSNASYYWLSGKFEQLSISQYSSRVAQYYLPYIQSPFLYVGIALTCYVIAYNLHQIKRESFESK